MKNIAIIFPNQLFELEYLPYKYQDVDVFIITEDPIFFSDAERQLKFNLLKLIYQRACMQYYYDYLSDHKLDIVYLEWQKDAGYLYQFIKKKYGTGNLLHIIDPVDHLLSERITKYAKKYRQDITQYQTPAFLCDDFDLEEYIKTNKKNKNFFQYNFYIWQRKRLNILMDKSGKPLGGKYSYDKYNRKSIPTKSFENFLKTNHIKVPKQKYDNDYYDEAIKYCEKTFKNHYPENYEPENIYRYPVTHADAMKNLKSFVKYKLKYFGDYQDAISYDDPYMFHSVISSQLNIGLLLPSQVLKMLLSYYKKTGNKRSLLNDVEGFIRQLNWREYSRLLYMYAYDDMRKNYFGNKNHLTAAWYRGDTGIEPVDSAIKTAFQYGYLHHIIRLMIMCNFMNLCQIDPDDVYAWFMEFSLDSYDWVMINNVYSMGLYADGGLTVTKPYISSSNYVLKLSGVKRDGYWDQVWTTLYYNFIGKNYNKFKGRGFIYRSQYDKVKDKNSIKKSATKYIRKLTK